MRLVARQHLPVAPQVIYLDSAHEKGETLLELHTAFRALSPGGVLFGDDTAWPAVRHDVLAFVSCLKPPSDTVLSIERAVASQLSDSGAEMNNSQCKRFATPGQMETAGSHHGKHAFSKRVWICPPAASSTVPPRRVLFYHNAWMIVKGMEKDDGLSAASDQPWCKFLKEFSLIKI